MSEINNVDQKGFPTGHNLVQNTTSATESVKLNDLIADEKKKIDDFYLEIGKKYYEIHRQAYEEQFEIMINGIDNAQKNIREYEHQLNLLNGVVICSKCGSASLSGSLFCKSCGARFGPLIENNEKNIISGNICERCGTVLTPDKLFCTNCGNKISPPPLTTELLSPQVEHDIQKNTVRCAICGKEISAEAGFCSGCGNKVIKGQNDYTAQTYQSGASDNFESIIRCPRCNKILSSTAAFCSGCGEKMKGE